MRERYRRELDSVDQDVVRMGALVEQAIEQATIALIESDATLALRVMEADNDIDDLYVGIEKRALSILAKQAPVAGDLRLIVAILRATHDLERAGDLAYNVAKVAAKQVPVARIKAISGLLVELSAESRSLLSKAIDAWAEKDVILARSLQDFDDDIDELHKRFYREIFALKQDETSFETAMNAALVGRWFERIADHGVNVAEGVQFYITGQEELLG
ncbi:MAG: phosphate signaling complex protein PhoU [Actinobacteria bacterium]|nr:phosphate signaling complex protein PhoU [Actinomycetota bacterium]